MRKFGLLGTSAIRSAAFIGFTMALASPSFAQGTADEEADPSTLQSEPEIESGVDATAGAQGEGATTSDAEPQITITGSRIRRPNLESTVPITSLGGEEFFQQGQTNIGETLNELPALRSTFAQSNPGLGIGIAGLNLLDLRGLGTQRTLVLVNGRRHVAADVLNNAVSPDVNTIPNDLIERVDVVTGGNSAVYGSDAIAGVVNFIFRRDFDGIQIRGNAGVSEEGYGGNQYISAMAGKNFGDGRGNVTLHGEYAHQRRVYTSDVPFLRQNDVLSTVDVDGTACLANGSNAATCDPTVTNGGDGIPDRIFIRDVRTRSINRFGLVPITQPIGGPAPCGPGIRSSAPNAFGTPLNCDFIFSPDGNLVPLTGGNFGNGVIGGTSGGNGQTGRERGLFSVLPFYERYNANLLAHFTVAEALEPFVEAKFSRVNVRGSNFGPGGIQGTFAQFDARERVRLDNPFLAPAARTTIANAILASGCNPSFTVACGVPTNPAQGKLTPAQIAQINAGTFRFVVGRNLLDVQARDETFSRDTFRIVGGLRGTFNTDWSYEVSANYGRTEEETQAAGYVNKQRFLLSLDAGRDPVTGQITCRAKFDPAARIAFPNNEGNQAALNADIAACVPYNPFGGADNSAAAAYFEQNYTVDAWADQFVLQAFMSGDTSGLVSLWGGPIRFALGAEYRKEQAFYAQSEEGASGNTTAVAFGTFDPPPFEVKEAFAEIQIPIFKDMPFFEDLTLSAAGRVADYKGATGTVFAYNAGAEWSPIRDLRFRANYGRAIRAPNSSETFGELIPNFAPGFTDPCASNFIGQGNAANRGKNCQEALGANLGNLNNNARSLPVLSGVNPNLQEETSKSLTIGAVLQPRFLPGFSLTVDYYDIKVNNVIAAANAQQIANGCYDLPTLDNPFCALFQRFQGPGTGPFGENAGEIQGNTLVQAPLNFASRVRTGIDFEAAYRTNLGTNSRLSSRLIYSHQLKNSNFQNPTDPTFENRILGELGDPEDEFRFDLDLTYKGFTLGYELRYIASMYVNAYEDFNPLNGQGPQDRDYADIQKYPEVFYHDLRFDWNLKEGGFGRDMNFFVGVDNIFDKEPPFGLTGTGAGSAIYSIRGRNFYGGFRARF
jgi:outer membrane receptor protein involved in Fe transport